VTPTLVTPLLFAVSSFPLDELRAAIAGGLNAGAFGAEQTVEPREVRLEVGQRPLVMHGVFDGAAPERSPTMRQSGQVVAGVGVGADPVVQHHHRPAGQRVRAEYYRRYCAEHAETDQFPRVVVLGHPDVDARVPVMHRVQVPVTATHTGINTSFAVAIQTNNQK